MHLLASFFDLFDAPPLRRDPVFVVGVHRSGTSALAGALSSLGLTVGKTVMPPHPDNPKGYYENKAITDLHDEFLADIGESWSSAHPINPVHFQGERADRFRYDLLMLMLDEFKQHERPVIKDPRLCQLLRLWLPIVQQHLWRASFVLPIRHPVEVAASLRKRDGFTLAQGVALWAVCALEAERVTRRYRRLFTTYEALLQSPLDTMRKVARTVRLNPNEVASSVPNKVDPTLRHHKNLDWPADDPHQKLILDIYQTLLAQDRQMEQRLDVLRRNYYQEREVLV
jgi:hypothetical protein